MAAEAAVAANGVLPAGSAYSVTNTVTSISGPAGPVDEEDDGGIEAWIVVLIILLVLFALILIGYCLSLFSQQKKHEQKRREMAALPDAGAFSDGGAVELAPVVFVDDANNNA